MSKRTGKSSPARPDAPDADNAGEATTPDTPTAVPLEAGKSAVVVTVSGSVQLK